MVNAVLGNMKAFLSDIYEVDMKRRTPKRKLLRDMLLRVFYRVCSARQPMEQTQFNMLFRSFRESAIDDAVRVPTVLTKKRERLTHHDAVNELFN